MTSPLILACAVAATALACGAKSDPATGNPDTAASGDRSPPGSQEACFEAWQKPEILVTARTRPRATPESPALRFVFDYLVEGPAARLVLSAVEEDGVVGGSDGPFSVGENSGDWVELQDAGGRRLYTQLVYQLVPESQEAIGGPGNRQLTHCPLSGSIRLRSFPNDSRATQVVFYQELVDGQATYRSVEFARFRLP